MWQFLPAGLSVLSLSALVYYHLQLRAGPVEPSSALQYLYAELYRAMGLAPAVMFFLLVAVWSVIWSVRGVLERPASKLVRLLVMALMIGIWVNLGDGGVAPALHKGAIGAWFAEALHASFGYWPSLLVVGAMTIASVMLATDFLFADLFEQSRLDLWRRVHGELHAEKGVEPQVSEHLKGLQSALPLANPPSPDVAAPPLRHESQRDESQNPRAAGEDPSAAFAAAIAAAARAVADRDPVDGDAVEERGPEERGPEAAEQAVEADESPARPTTYEERRRQREARRWGRIQDEGWVPTSPESQEIDNAEAQVAAETTVAPEMAHDRVVANAFAAERAAGDPTVESNELAAGDPGESEPRASELAQAASGDADAIAGDEQAEPEAELPFGAAAWTPEAADEPASVEAQMPRHASNGVAEAPWSPSVEPAYELPLPESAPLGANVDAPAESTPGEAIVAIPRPEPVTEPAIDPVIEPVIEPVAAQVARDAAEPALARQQSLFGGGLDQGLVQEAIDLVVGARRASAGFLQRKLRIDYPLAVELLAELAARGVVALEGDASHGRVLL